MTDRSATYHGVVLQGHPSGKTNTEQSLDKRYFGNDHYESILKCARGFLDEDWLKYSWDGGSPDAQFRAALDMAIHTADSGAYQSKIDSETYGLLLNRLAGWDYDSFSETIFPKGKKRSAADMNRENLRAIIRIASDLRTTDPEKAFGIIRNLRAMVSSEAAAAPSISAHVAQQDQEDDQEDEESPVAQDQQGQQECMSQEQQGQQEQQAENHDVLHLNAPPNDVHQHMEKIKDALGPLHLDEADVQDFLSGLEERVMGKTASVRVPLALAIRLAHKHPEIRPVLLPILAAAKKKEKKKDKKEPAKTSQGKKGKKGKKPGKKSPPPFGGKKAPPFGKQSSLNVEAEDFSW